MDGWRWSAGISRWLEVLVMLEEGADPMSPAMPFGRHRGAPLNELPEHYLQWLGGKLDEWRIRHSRRRSPAPRAYEALEALARTITRQRWGCALYLRISTACRRKRFP